jgi:hypothetical protein
MSHGLYIYWRVLPEQLPQATAAARRMQTELRSALPGLTAKLFIRQETAGMAKNHHTLMEVYQNLPGEDSAAHIEAAAQVALTAYAQGQRHVEVFAEVRAADAAAPALNLQR